MPSIQVFDFGAVACDKTEYNQQAGNANILIFRDDGWPHDLSGGGTDVLALTTVTYDVVTGDIYDADIEVNTFDFTFTTSDSPGVNDYDLLSVLTHESGHFLGLAHSQTTAATMFASYQGLGMRHPQEDDVNAVCNAYPVDRQATGACTGIPRHGWAPLCAAEQPNVTCSASGRASTGGGAFAIGLALAAASSRWRVRGAGQRPTRKPRLVRKPEIDTPVSRSMAVLREGRKVKPSCGITSQGKMRGADAAVEPVGLGVAGVVRGVAGERVAVAVGAERVVGPDALEVVGRIAGDAVRRVRLHAGHVAEEHPAQAHGAAGAEGHVLGGVEREAPHQIDGRGERLERAADELPVGVGRAALLERGVAHPVGEVAERGGHLRVAGLAW